jgi:hypothetical protein
MDRTAFFTAIRGPLFSGRLDQGQVDGIEAILDAWQARPVAGDIRWLAYMLATAHHETARTMQPVRETLADSDEAAIAILDAAFRKGRLSWVREPYWRRDADGKSWLGRGLVQLTHKRNYEVMSRETGIDLVAEPDRAMEMDVAVRILLSGMERGLFTGRKLGDYFAGARADWVNARRIINGLDRAALVAGHARCFFTAATDGVVSH